MPEDEKSFVFLQDFGISPKVGDPFVSFAALFRVLETQSPNTTIGDLWQLSYTTVSSEIIVSDLSQMAKVQEMKDNRNLIALLGNSGYLIFMYCQIFSHSLIDEIFFVNNSTYQED